MHDPLADHVVILDRFTDSNYMYKVNNRKSRERCEVCSKLTIKTPEGRHWRRSGLFIVNVELIFHNMLQCFNY